ncbi:uncharacterized [Lates japonicus]
MLKPARALYFSPRQRPTVEFDTGVWLTLAVQLRARRAATSLPERKVLAPPRFLILHHRPLAETWIVCLEKSRATWKRDGIGSNTCCHLIASWLVTSSNAAQTGAAEEVHRIPLRTPAQRTITVC